LIILQDGNPCLRSFCRELKKNSVRKASAFNPTIPLAAGELPQAEESEKEREESELGEYSPILPNASKTQVRQRRRRERL
jgi:hypothetical protein